MDRRVVRAAALATGAAILGFCPPVRAQDLALRVREAMLSEHVSAARGIERCRGAAASLEAAIRAGRRESFRPLLSEVVRCRGPSTTPAEHVWSSPMPAADGLSLGPIVSRVPAPPPIAGGTLLVTRDGRTAVAADPDRDRVYIVDLAGRTLRAAVALRPGDEPGRAIEGTGGRAHVVLRRGGALASIDLADGSVDARRPVCAAPRGVALGPDGLLHVACAGGELVSLREADGERVRTIELEPDLRDVVVEGDHLLVSRFRSAELLEIDAGAVAARRTPPRHPGIESQRRFTSSIAWRMRAAPAATVMAHQLGTDTPVSIQPSGYGGPGGAGTIVHSAVTVFRAGGPQIIVVEDAPLPVDVAVHPDGQRLVLVAAGNHRRADGHGQVLELLAPPSVPLVRVTPRPLLPATDPHEVVAVEIAPSGEVVLQSREPAAVGVDGAWIELGAPSAEDSGHAMFHMATRGGLACASCHPEGADDGRVWTFTGVGRRRTQTLDVGVIGTEPFHWTGELADLPALVDEVYVRRMSGLTPSPDHVLALAAWLDGLAPIPAPPARDAAAVARGEGHFRDGRSGCAGCHAGPRFVGREAVDVGTGGRFQVPSLLGLASRARFMHDGCAGTLEDRFGRCGGQSHGSVAHLAPGEVSDLVAYLRTL